MVCGYLILISSDFYDFYFYVSLIEKIHRILKTVFDGISKHLKALHKYVSIFGDQGATSRDDAIFSGKSLLQELKCPWELILTEPGRILSR